MMDRYDPHAPCPHCFESSGYVWQHGNDWESGPWSVQTKPPIPNAPRNWRSTSLTIPAPNPSKAQVRDGD